MPRHAGEGQRHTHSDQLGRWLGHDVVENISRSMRRWYGPPIALAGVPGKVFATRGGDFVGPIHAGRFVNGLDAAVESFKRYARRYAREAGKRAGMGFATIDAIRDAITQGKRRDFAFSKTTGTRVSNACQSLWAVGNVPAAGGAASNAPGGRACDDATTGGFPYVNPPSGTLHYLNAMASASQGSSTILLYDRLFDVNKTMNSSATESVTGIPTRYQNTTLGAEDSAEGSFIFIECFSALAATAHNWTVCLYRDESNNDNQTLPSVTGNSGNIVNRLDMPTLQWFCPLATGDTGVMDLAQMQCSALVATGAIHFVIGHPLAFIPIPLTNVMCLHDGVFTGLDLVRIFNDACLSALDVFANNTSSNILNFSVTSAFGG